MQHDAVNQDAVSAAFELPGAFPRPGWVVLDAAREHRFTGELLFDTSPPVRVCFDGGRIYLAERVSDPSIGARLVDAGALTAVQLERGAIRIGDIEHLGRLFERVPKLDRHAVMVTAELMTEECVGWLAPQRVPDVGWAPYRHHESGIHQWSRLPPWTDLSPGEPLPAPPADEAPVSCTPPATEPLDLVSEPEPFLDGMIEWDEPSWLDGPQLDREIERPVVAARIEPEHDAPAGFPGPAAVEEPADVESEPEGGDWVDRLVLDGLPDDDLLAAPRPLPRLPVEPIERFELVWPSGEIDEDFGGVESVVGNGHDLDADRIGASTRLARPTVDEPPVPLAPPGDELGWPGGHDDETSDQVVLAVRRAVASIEVGSLVARQRLVDTGGPLDAGSRGMIDADDPDAVPAPGRVAVRSGRNDWSRRTVTRSVFDEPTAEPAPAEPEPEAMEDDHRERRAGALRRLITSLRR